MKKFLIVILFLLTGCYNYTELNSLAIVKGAAIDFEEGKYVLSYAISNASKDQSLPQAAILEGRGDTISDAIAEMNLSSPKELYIGHMLVYIISEDVAQKGISEITDYFFRNPTSKKTFQIIISKDKKAKDVLKVLSPLDNFPADNIAKNLTTESSLSSFAINTTLLSFIKNIKDPGIEAVASGITIIGDENEASKEENLENSKVENYVKIEPLAIFKNDKFVKWADEDISKGITILYNQNHSSKIDANCDNKKVVFALSDLDVKKNFIINEKVKFKIKITADTEIREMTCDFDLQNQNDLKKLEDILINSLKNILKDTIEEIKKTKIDSIGLGNYIYQNDYYNYLKIKDTYLDNLEVEFEIIPNLLASENTNEGTVNINE